MQCCTLLRLAFMEKGQPAIAATWYERALAMPGLDQETILALRYDLGVAQELAGDMAAARKSFSQVYAMNIAYRDVAERLSSLGNERYRPLLPCAAAPPPRHSASTRVGSCPHGP